MILPINSVSVSHKGYNGGNLTKQMHIEKLQNLIKEFEELAKGNPANEALKNHIDYLKKSLGELLKK